VSISRRLLASLLLALTPLGVAAAGEVRGRVALGVAGADLAAAGPIVVYLEGVDGPLHFEPPKRKLEIHQKDAEFSPSFLVISAGETVEMPNDDVIFHNVFSYSTPNDFDLGLYPRGQSRNKTFQYPGVVRFYCSIHESMNGTIFVAPSFAHAAAPDGVSRLRRSPEAIACAPGTGGPATQIIDVGRAARDRRADGGAGAARQAKLCAARLIAILCATAAFSIVRAVFHTARLRATSRGGGGVRAPAAAANRLVNAHRDHGRALPRDHGHAAAAREPEVEDPTLAHFAEELRTRGRAARVHGSHGRIQGGRGRRFVDLPARATDR
jgi:plastocyanin